MSKRKSNFITIGGKVIHFSEWGEPSNPTVVCVHGLTRNGRDFDTLAEHLSTSYHVICPDILGRGLSQWSRRPDVEYCFRYYEDQMVGLLNELTIEQVRWVGTSMGGALGIRAAGGNLKGRITHLVLNDIGAGPTEEALKNASSASAEAIQTILTYTANPPKFETMLQLKNYFQQLYPALGFTGDQQWLKFTQNSARRTDNGQYTPDYDPNIVKQFTHVNDLVLWNQWDQITGKVMVIRGEISGILPLDTVEEMAKRGPSIILYELKGLGHAPGLDTKEQLDFIEKFIKS
jgi:pimeloyl-ACP methyl ester carboxylesterase